MGRYSEAKKDFRPMIKNIFFVLISLLLLYSFKETCAEEKEPRLRNPFLTPEEEMKVLGIKPTQEKGRTIIPLEKLNLSGIMYGKIKIVIINSEFYSEGDLVGNFTVKKIKPLSVILNTERREYELKLKHVLATKEKPKDGSREGEATEREDEISREEWSDDIIEKLLGATE